MVDIRLLAILAPAIALSATAVTAGPRADDVMPTAARTLAPAGYADMCRRVPQECLSAASPTPQRLTMMRDWANQARWAAVFSHSSSSPRVETAALDGYLRPDKVPAQIRPAVHQGSGDIEPWSAPLDAALAGAPETLYVGARPDTVAASPVPTVAAPALPASIAQRESALAAVLRADQKVSHATTSRVTTSLSIRELSRINNLFNRAIRNASDAAVYGKADYWVSSQENRGRGDCEDYVLAKRKALIRAGVDPRALSIAIVKTRRDEMHAILLVQTPRGELVMDNLSPWILSWRDAPYTWVSRQVAGSAVDWVSIDLG